MHDDLRSLIPAANGFSKFGGAIDSDNEEPASTNDVTNGSKMVMPQFEIEYVGMDDSAIGTARVTHIYRDILLL